VALVACAVLVDRHERRAGALLAGLLLGSLLALYVASRVVVVWPLEHVEPVDGLGVITKLFEAAGLVLALSLLQNLRSSDETLPAHREGASQ
jgi:hypothetical protein